SCYVFYVRPPSHHGVGDSPGCRRRRPRSSKRPGAVRDGRHEGATWREVLWASQGGKEAAERGGSLDITPAWRGRPKERGVCGTFVLDIEVPIQGRTGQLSHPGVASL